MKKTLTVLILTLFSLQLSYAQSILNMTKISEVDYPELCNDVWGYVDPDDGSEYAILGTVLATAVLDLSDPANPEEIAYIPGSNSTWRDMKQWEEYVYVTTDAGNDGLLIIDMSQAPDTVTWEFWQPELTVGTETNTLNTCHNVYIDEKGFAYLSGCNLGNEGVIILDIHTTPGTPIMVGATDERYSHDNFARGDTLYSADISAGIFSITDISDRANPVELATQSTSFNFTHNIWPSTDGRYVFTTDERANAYVDAYDISDLNNIKHLDSYRPKDTEGTDVIPHNTHYLEGGYLVTSWYTDGIIIVDANRPENMVKVANYDTNTEFYDGFHGCWGAYPFLPSGLMLASDRENGLFVFSVDLKRASYLEGRITNSVSNSPVNGASVEFLNAVPNGADSNSDGDYKTGLEQAGNYDVVYSKLGYYPDTFNVSITAGEVTIQDVELEPIATFSGRVIAASNGAGVNEADVVIFNETQGYLFSTTANGNGDFIMPTFIPEENYTIVAGKWGYKHQAMDQNISANASITLVLEEGYQDDFILEQGWTVNSTASSGIWVREEPIGTSRNQVLANPEFDVDGDIGDLAYITGNGGGSAGTDDIDNGATILSSPPMDLTSMNEPLLSYRSWFFFLDEPNDSMIISISNGTETATLEVLTESASGWRLPRTYSLKDYIDITDNMIFSCYIADQSFGNVLEGGLDVFLVEDGQSTPVSEVLTDDLRLTAFPNPFNGEVSVRYQNESGATARLEVYNLLGQGIEQIRLGQQEETLSIGSQWQQGVYFIHLIDENQQRRIVKVVKQ